MAQSLDRGDKIYSYTVPVIIGGWTTVVIGSDPLHVACQVPWVVEFWALSGFQSREFAIVATGQPIPTPARHWGTVLDGSFVWHLIERT